MTGHVQCSVRPKVEAGFKLFDENAPGGVLDGRRNKGGSKVLGRESGNGEPPNPSYNILNNRRGVKEKDL